MSTFMANKGNITRKWYVIDAAGKPLGKTAVAAAELFLKQRCILRVGAFHAHGMEKLFFMFEHTRNTPLSVFHDLVCAADGGGIR